MTPWWIGLLLGALGATVADGSKIGNVLVVSKRWPWSKPGQRLPFAVGILLRCGSASILSAVIAAQGIVGWSNQPLALFIVGLSTPTIVQHVTRLGRAIVKAILAEYFSGGGV